MGNLPGSAFYVSGTKLRTCKRCGTTRLAWAESKSGRFYLCSAQRSESESPDMLDAYVVQPWQPHRCQTPTT